MSKMWQINDAGMQKVDNFLKVFLTGFNALLGERKANALIDAIDEVELKACNFARGESCVLLEVRAVESTTGRAETLYLYPDDFKAWEVEE